VTDKEQLPPNIRVLKNGSHYDVDKGRLVKGPTSEHYLTPERGRQLQPLAIQARYRRGKRGLVAAVQEHTGKTGLSSLDAYEHLTYEVTASALANMMEKPRDSVPAVKQALRMADMAPAEGDRPQAAATVTLTMSADGLAQLQGLLQRGAPQLADVVDGEAREVKE
jgi:hypothetical protein